MGDNESQIKINIVTTADPGGVQQARSQYDELFDDLKKGVTSALSGQGVDSKFIGHVADEFDRLNKELKETGASGDEVAAKIAKMQGQLVAAAEAEERRVRQLKVNFQVALEEKELQEQAAAQQRMRRSEDQLAMEAEGRELKKNTELLEQEIMVRLKAERVTREAATAAKGVGTAMQGTKRDIAGALLVGAQFADDMQYGLRAVTNQLPQLAAAFGLGAGVAGVIGIAAVAVNLLWAKFGGAKDAKAETPTSKRHPPQDKSPPPAPPTADPQSQSPPSSPQTPAADGSTAESAPPTDHPPFPSGSSAPHKHTRPCSNAAPAPSQPLRNTRTRRSYPKPPSEIRDSNSSSASHSSSEARQSFEASAKNG